MRFTNYYEHSSDTRFMVYEFYVVERADYFERLLTDRQVEYERYLDTDTTPHKTLFGVNKRFLKVSNNCNFLTHAHYRSPLIPNKIMQWVLLLFMAFIIALAVVGWLKTR